MGHGRNCKILVVIGSRYVTVRGRVRLGLQLGGVGKGKGKANHAPQESIGVIISLFQALSP